MMNLTKKKSTGRTQINEFGSSTALVDAAKSDAQAVAAEVHAAAGNTDAASSYSAARSVLDGMHGEAQLEVIPLSPGLVVDKLAPLPVTAVDNSLDTGKLLSSVYIDQSGGWGLQVAPESVPDASEQAVASANEKASEAEVLELARPIINLALADAGAIGEIDNGGTTDDATPTFSGYGEPFARLEIYDNGLAIGDTEIGEDGIWSFTVSESLALGEHSITVAVAGVMSDPFALTVSFPEADEPAADGLALDELLQPPAAELMAGDEAGILPVGEAAHALDLSRETFGSSVLADGPSVAAAGANGGVLLAPTPMPAELWQPDPT
ncbi:Ig-like domain-containing protein [Collimonas sp.]|uniref:Ig-like domain-containing protein n=1 Tax=Collimonas sp. TaxID=1963772 RepID=UPI002C536F99|nr:Ig-like domain-containing protein [Collimonas sp.]HWX02010.1 Ig-like domain-containing protein [Collimonas sp.]